MNILRGSRKYFFAVLGIFTALVCFFIAIVYWSGREYGRVSLTQKYWFLVRDCEESTSAAVIETTYLSGGAGFLIDAGGEQAVVLACYYTEVSAQSVQRTLGLKGVETRIIKLSPSEFTLNGNAASQIGLIVSNAETADTCAKILYDTANGLERTEISQEEARSAVRGVVGSLKGMREGNTDNVFGLWNAAIFAAERRGTEIASGILFAKDLRYLQVLLCYSVANMSDYF